MKISKIVITSRYNLFKGVYELSENHYHDLMFSDHELVIMLSMAVGHLKKIGINPETFYEGYEDEEALRMFREVFAHDQSNDAVDFHCRNILKKVYDGIKKSQEGD